MAEGDHLDREAFRQLMGAFPTGVTAVTALGADGPSGMTANAVASLSLDPMLMLVCFDREARTLRSVGHSRRFAINVLAVGQERLARAFGAKTPELEKWTEVDWSERHGSPTIEGAVAWVACELEQTHDGGDHVIAVGSVLAAGGGQGEPLVFHGGEFRRLC